MNIMVFDIETIPDVQAGRRLYDLQGLDDADVARVLACKQLEKSGGHNDFLPLPLHQVVAISIVLRRGDQFRVWSLGDIESNEKEIISRFFEGIERYAPTLVSWNGSAFDLPVLHYRSLLHGITASRYWDGGEEDREFKWNNYLNRYHSRHTDLMDVLAAYQLRAATPLDQLSVMLGFPGKMGFSGADVWQQYQDGKLQDIRNYCETDVLNTFLVYLRWELVRGSIDTEGYDSECDRVESELRRLDKSHLNTFLDSWSRQVH